MTVSDLKLLKFVNFFQTISITLHFCICLYVGFVDSSLS